MIVILRVFGGAKNGKKIEFSEFFISGSIDFLNNWYNLGQHNKNCGKKNFETIQYVLVKNKGVKDLY